MKPCPSNTPLLAATMACVLAWPLSPQAQTVAAGAYYAPPAWSQTLPSATRFIVLSNFESATVLDRETGLVWARKVAFGQVGQTYVAALSYCANLVLAGRGGWRLPTLAEATSLVDPAQPARLPAGHPFDLGSWSDISGGNTPSAIWTSTAPALLPSQVWIVHLNQSIGSTFARLVTVSADGGAPFLPPWCVRGRGD